MESPLPTQAKTILLVDEEHKYRITARWLLGNFGFIVESARTAKDALSLFNAKTHAVVVTDNSLNGMSGTELAHVIKMRSPSTPVIMCSALLPEDRTCLDVLIQKPVSLLALKAEIERVLAGLPCPHHVTLPAWKPCACAKGSLWAQL